jgi:hypothetical protein
MEGERRIPLPAVPGGGPAAAAHGGAAASAPAAASGGRKMPQISMTNAQYVENETGIAEEAQDAEDDIGSDVLSRDEDSVLSAFDAVERLGADLEALEAADDHGMQALSDQDDHLSRQQIALMDKQEAAPKRKGRPEPKAKAKAGRRRKKNDGPTGGRTKDPRFKTDVFEVRQALREAHRNMPFEDFKKMVNFMIRGVTRIGDFANQITYWHIDDPSFRHATGVHAMHSYSEKLLLAMGFVCVADTYWVWPEKHLSRGNDWGHQSVPPECPGLSNHRLHDMVVLLKACQQGFATEGKTFRGHFH